MIEREAKFDSDRAEDRPGHLQPAVPQACRCRSTPRCSTGRTRTRRSPTSRTSTRRTTPTCTPGLPPTPIANPGRASIEAALNPAPNPGQGDPICAGLPAEQCLYLYYVKIDKDGHHAFSATLDQQEANIAAGSGRRRPTGDHRTDPSCRGDRPPGRAQPVAGAAQRRLRLARARLGVRRLRRRGRRRPATRWRRCARSASAGCRSRCRTRRTSPRAVDVLDPAAAALRSVNTVVAAARRPTGRAQHRRRRVRRLDVGAPAGRSRVARVCVLGAGAAARSIVEALARNRAPARWSWSTARPTARRRRGGAGRRGRSGRHGAADVRRRRHRGQRHLGGHGHPRAAARPGAAARRPGRRRHRLPPATHGPARRRRRSPAPPPSTASGCSSTRRRCNRRCGPGTTPDIAAMAAAANRELAARERAEPVAIVRVAPLTTDPARRAGRERWLACRRCAPRAGGAW